MMYILKSSEGYMHYRNGRVNPTAAEPYILKRSRALYQFKRSKANLRYRINMETQDISILKDDIRLAKARLARAIKKRHELTFGRYAVVAVRIAKYDLKIEKLRTELQTLQQTLANFERTLRELIKWHRTLKISRWTYRPNNGPGYHPDAHNA